jgi:2-acylglycerol O-acyltransferase 2
MVLEYVVFYGVLLIAPLSLLLTVYVLGHLGRYWAVVLVYAVWLAYSWTRPFTGLSHKRPWLCRLLRPSRDYFPCRLEGPPSSSSCALSSSPSSASSPRIYLCYPHGVLAWGPLLNFAFTDDRDVLSAGSGGSKSSKGVLPVKVLTLNANLLIPLWRDLLLGLGMASVNRATIGAILERGDASPALVLGGAREAALAEAGRPRVLLSRRRGIFDLALRHGVPLVPVFTFGELEVVQAYRLPTFISNALHHLTGYMVVVPGLPQRHPLVTIIGEAVPVMRVADPTSQDILLLQNQFRHALLALYAQHHARFQYPPHLEIL